MQAVGVDVRLLLPFVSGRFEILQEYSEELSCDTLKILIVILSCFVCSETLLDLCNIGR